MKTIIYSDFASSKSLLIQQVLIEIFIAAALSIGMSSLHAVIPAVVCTFCTSLVFSLVSFDENNNWQRYRLCLPLNRTQIILGRYLSVLLMSLVSFLFGIIIFFILAFLLQTLNGAIPFSAELVSQAETISLDVVVLLVALSIFVSFAFNAVILPLAARFGMNRALRLAPMAFMILIFGVVFCSSFLAQGNDGTIILQFFEWITASSTIYLASGLIIFAACAIYAISFIIASVLYKQREF